VTPLALIGAVPVFVAVGYALRCAVDPTPPCLACRGRGSHLYGLNTCSLCDGDGVRLRWGVRVARTFRSSYR